MASLGSATNWQTLEGADEDKRCDNSSWGRHDCLFPSMTSYPLKTFQLISHMSAPWCFKTRNFYWKDNIWTHCLTKYYHTITGVKCFLVSVAGGWRHSRPLSGSKVGGERLTHWWRGDKGHMGFLLLCIFICVCLCIYVSLEQGSWNPINKRHYDFNQ